MPKAKVLVVDDAPNTVFTLKLGLESKGYEVSTACDGVEGLEKFQSERPDLTLLDLNLPRMDGIAVLRKIREIDPQATVVLITAYSSIEDAKRAIEASGCEYIRKPSSIAEIAQVLDGVLERKRSGTER